MLPGRMMAGTDQFSGYPVWIANGRSCMLSLPARALSALGCGCPQVSAATKGAPAQLWLFGGLRSNSPLVWFLCLFLLLFWRARGMETTAWSFVGPNLRRSRMRYGNMMEP